MTDIEKLHVFTEALLWMPYIYFRKMVLANHEFIEELLTFPT